MKIYDFFTKPCVNARFIAIFLKIRNKNFVFYLVFLDNPVTRTKI